VTLIDVERDLDFARRLADAARVVALPLFRTALDAESKHSGGFDPVTRADREVEAALRALIAAERPGDGVRGEEHAETASSTGRTWILDPIDGTRAFISGLPTWTVLIALAGPEGPALSVIDQPFTGERFSGVRGGGAWFERGGAREEIRANGGARLAEATGSTTDPFLFEGAEAEAFARARSAARLMRYGLDAYGYAQIAMGGVDFVIESGLQPWDVAALIPVLEGAGGVVTDWQGRPRPESGQVLAAANRALHAELVALLAG
jgi:histidinol phosphatase-like enzyme (inositol monophosphatase family)